MTAITIKQAGAQVSGGDMAKVNNDYRVWLVGQVYDCGVHNDARTVWKLGL